MTVVVCALRTMYVDEESYQFGSGAIESGLNNPFRCEAGVEGHDDLAYER